MRTINVRLTGFIFVLIAGLAAGFGGGLLARPVREAADPGRVAFQRTLDFVASASPSMTVPAGKRLALTYIAITMNVAPGQQALASIRTSVGENVAEYPLIMTKQVSNFGGNDIYFCSQSLSGIFADAGTEVVINGKTTSSRSFNGKISVSGVMVD